MLPPAPSVDVVYEWRRSKGSATVRERLEGSGVTGRHGNFGGMEFRKAKAEVAALVGTKLFHVPRTGSHLLIASVSCLASP